MPPLDADHSAAPESKKLRLVGSSDRVALNVGGERFTTTSTTLTSHSSYFAALFSDEWISGHDGEELFLDQDPAAFRKLLSYMRCGILRAEDADAELLILAEFLGIDRLLAAAKARWYVNIGRGPVPDGEGDQDLAAAFDEVHGGVTKAIALGLHPMFLRQNDVDAEKYYAPFTVQNDTRRLAEDSLELLLSESVCVEELEDVHGECLPDCTDTGGIVGALNGLQSLGYTEHESSLSSENSPMGYRVLRTTFSMRKHAYHYHADDKIFIDEKYNCSDRMKQFAVILIVQHGEDRIIAPSEFSEDAEVRENTFAAHILEEGQEWLERNGFATREEEFESLFAGAMNCMENQVSGVGAFLVDGVPRAEDVEGRIYSRLVARA